MDRLTREIFGNVSELSQWLFYGLALGSVTIFALGVLRRARVWRLGRVPGKWPKWPEVVRNLWRNVAAQRRVRSGGARSLAHGLLFYGFCTLFVGTILIAIEHILAVVLGRDAHHPVFHRGLYFAVYEVVLDAAGLAFLTGCALLAYRPTPHRAARELRDRIVLGLFAAIGATGFVLEGLRILVEQTPVPQLSFIGFAVASIFASLGISRTGAASCHVALWWFHAALSLGLIAWFPYSRLLHAIAGSVRLAAGVDRLGTLRPVSFADVEETGEIGTSRFDQMTSLQLVELDACVSCGLCEASCPAFEAGKPLSPRDVIQDLRRNLDLSDFGAKDGSASLAGGVVAAETLWACTTCSACVDVCPLGVNPLGFITDMRRHLIAESQLRGAPAKALERVGRTGNPWGLPAQDRFAWAADLELPTVESQPDFEVLYWVGCAASYDRRLQSVARSVVRLLRAAGVRFAVLAGNERCTGEAVRRMGDELLFQQLATDNLSVLERAGVLTGAKRIVAHCPHCVNSLRLDYGQLGARLEIVHHTQYLDELIKSGRLKLSADISPSGDVTYHDPCYLARVQGVTDEPRALLSIALHSTEPASAGRLVEMPRCGRQTTCCGAGGGRMWFDDAPATRTGGGRIDEALATGASTLAVACPFCLVMTSDGLAARGAAMNVRDVAELLADRLPANS